MLTSHSGILIFVWRLKSFGRFFAVASSLPSCFCTFIFDRTIDFFASLFGEAAFLFSLGFHACRYFYCTAWQQKKSSCLNKRLWFDVPFWRMWQIVYYHPRPESLNSWRMWWLRLGIYITYVRASNILAVGRILFFLISSRKYAQNRGEAEVFAGRGGH